MISIRRTLLVSLLIGVLIVGVALSTGVYFVARELPLAEAKRIDLGMVRSERAAVRGDANPLRIMLRNLIDNAIRYTLGARHKRFR